MRMLSYEQGTSLSFTHQIAALVADPCLQALHLGGAEVGVRGERVELSSNIWSRRSQYPSFGCCIRSAGGGGNVRGGGHSGGADAHPYSAHRDRTIAQTSEFLLILLGSLIALPLTTLDLIRKVLVLHLQGARIGFLGGFLSGLGSPCGDLKPSAKGDHSRHRRDNDAQGDQLAFPGEILLRENQNCRIIKPPAVSSPRS
jgi:hypothetical protein